MIGEPRPTVSWKRAKGEINDPEKFQNKYDPVTNEHTLEVRILNELIQLSLWEEDFLVFIYSSNKHVQQ